MKAILTLIFILFFSTSAIAQNEVKVNAITMNVELNITIDQDGMNGNKVARLYRFKNSRVKKSLEIHHEKEQI